MTFRSYREQSRIDWGLAEPGAPMTVERIQLGAVLRIADATEKMAQRHTELLRAAAGHMLRADQWYQKDASRPVMDALVQTLDVDAKAVKLVAAKAVKAKHAAALKAIQDKINAQKPAPADVPAAQAPKGAGAKPKTSKPAPARAAKTTAEEAQRGIATAMQGLEASAQADADPLYAKARALVIQEQRASKGLLKEHLQIGQDKALALLDQLTADGVVSAAAERQARKVLVAA